MSLDSFYTKHDWFEAGLNWRGKFDSNKLAVVLPSLVVNSFPSYQPQGFESERLAQKLCATVNLSTAMLSNLNFTLNMVLTPRSLEEASVQHQPLSPNFIRVAADRLLADPKILNFMDQAVEAGKSRSRSWIKTDGALVRALDALQEAAAPLLFEQWSRAALEHGFRTLTLHTMDYFGMSAGRINIEINDANRPVIDDNVNYAINEGQRTGLDNFAFSIEANPENRDLGSTSLRFQVFPPKKPQRLVVEQNKSRLNLGGAFA